MSNQTTDLLSFKQSFKNTQKELAAMTVYNCGSQRCTPGYTWGPGIRDHYLIHYIISGSGVFSDGHHDRPVEAGQAFLVHPNTTISYHADKKNPWHYCWIGFSGIDAGLLVNKMPFTEEAPVLSVADGAAVQKAFKKVWKLRGSNFENMIEMTGALYLALSLFLIPDDHVKMETIDYFEKAVIYIKNYYFFYSTKVQDIADYVGVNRSYLYTIFKEKAGISPKEYLTQFRISQACNLLKRTDLSIRAISFSVGYEDNLYFSKVFQKIKGQTPTAYRKTEKG